MSAQVDRVLFANQLRGIAVLAVMFVHWCGVYWLSRDMVSSYIYAPVIDQEASNLIFLLTPPNFNYGPFGVAIFFLISGFVIPFSLSKANPLEFLVSRAFRIYPTYMAGSLLMLACLWLSAHYWGKPFEMNMFRLITNLLLVNTYTFQPSIDLVNWTLSIEIKFHIVCALLYRSIRGGKDWHLLLCGLAIFLLCTFYPESKSIIKLGKLPLSINALKTELMCVIFMLIGTGFYFLHTQTVKTFRFCLYAMAMLGLFHAAWQHCDWKSYPPVIFYSYLYGLIAFSLFFMLRKHARPFWPLDFLASISYPIYVTHSIIGYSLIRIQMDQGVPYLTALASTFTAIMFVAWVLHETVEKKTLGMGKKILRPTSATALPATKGQID